MAAGVTAFGSRPFLGRAKALACATTATLTIAAAALASPALAAHNNRAARPPRAASRAAATFATALRSYLAGDNSAWRSADTTGTVRAVIEATGPLPTNARAGRLELVRLRFEAAGVPVSFTATYRNARHTLPVGIRLAQRGGRWLVVSLLGPDYDVALAPRPRTPAPARASRAPRRAAVTFLHGYLPYLFGHGRASKIRDATPRLLAHLEADPPRVPPGMARMHAHALDLGIARDRHGWVAEAAVSDHSSVFQLQLQIIRTRGRWLVAAVRFPS